MQYRVVKKSIIISLRFLRKCHVVYRIFHITNKFDKTVLLSCVKKWNFICHILETGVNHSLSSVKMSRGQVATA